MLKYAACALAAKHLSRTEHTQSATASLRSLARSLSRVSQPGTQATWAYQAAQYYSRALGLLKKAMRLPSFADETAESPETVNMFAAVAILGTYELMDAPAKGWPAHLDALPMFTSTSAATACSPTAFPRTTIKGSAFWNLVRLDLNCACMFIGWCIFCCLSIDPLLTLA